MDDAFIERKKKSMFKGILLFFMCMLIITAVLSLFKVPLPFTICLFIIGIVLLVEGADWMISSAAHLAKHLKIPPIIVGLFFVAVFTSIPELAVSVYSAYLGEADIALGTIIGSSITNIGLVLGVTAMISPLVVESFTVLLEAPFLLLASVILFVLSFRLFDFGSATYIIGKLDGLLMLLFFLIFIVYTWKNTVFKESQKVSDEFMTAFTTGLIPFAKTLFVFLIGLGAVFLGASIVVNTGLGIATGFHIEKTVVGLILIAIGTSLPEFVVALVGMYKKEYDLVIGNILGSCIITILFVVGITALYKPLLVNVHLVFVDMIVLMLMACFFQIFITTDKTVSRKEGAVLFLMYLCYIVYTIIYAM
ncbi:MAG: calcium/sodium antiporter [Candidatus Woesearchaeota archaeon]|jgi:cation:H+ antiporter